MEGIFWEEFFRRIYWEDFFGRIFWEDFLWEDFLEELLSRNQQGIDVFVKISG